ncbi:MAG: DUF5018-related domain-containing protein [Breznakibacter sp.]
MEIINYFMIHIMKKTYLFSILVGLLATSCLKSGLEDLPAFNLTKITSFNMEYRFEAKNANSVSYVEVVTLPTSTIIDTVKNIVTVTPSRPVANAVFTREERKKVNMTNILGYCSLETAASIKPIGNSPKLGVPGDWTADRQYLVTAADGRTTREWTIKVNPLPIISNYEGMYKETGTLVRGSNAPELLDATIFLETVNANTLRAQAGSSIFNNPAILYQIQINSDNSVTIKSDPNSSVAITAQQGVASSYNPATKTFDLHYEYTTSALRKFDTKLVIVP